MKLIALKPIYFGGTVVTEGQALETFEQHGRELILKGYAIQSALDSTDDVDQQEEHDQHPEQETAQDSPAPDEADTKASKKAKK